MKKNEYEPKCASKTRRPRGNNNYMSTLTNRRGLDRKRNMIEFNRSNQLIEPFLLFPGLASFDPLHRTRISFGTPDLLALPREEINRSSSLGAS